MPARLISIAELQPTDTLRIGTVEYLAQLSPEEIEEKHGLPQVWQTDCGLLISDGNQRVANYAKKGARDIKIDLCKADMPDYLLDYLNLVISRAETLRKQGIYSPIDLWQA